MENGYNGWANRATWNVALWLNNDEGLYRYYQSQKDTIHNSVDFETLCRDIFGDAQTPDGDKLSNADWDELYQDLIVDK